MDLKTQMDGIYRQMPPDTIPWNIPTPPRLLVDLVDAGWVSPCDVVDLGCGAGNYAVWLAARGFRVTGVDVSAAALDIAERLAQDKGVSCRWVRADLTEPLEAGLSAAFDFAYDWEVLHHVFPEHRQAFVANVDRMLRPAGRYLSVCFSEEDRTFEGEGPYRQTRIGTRLYFSSERELRTLFSPWFTIEQLSTLEIEGKTGPHRMIEALLVKRG